MLQALALQQRTQTGRLILNFQPLLLRIRARHDTRTGIQMDTLVFDQRRTQRNGKLGLRQLR